MPKSLTRRLPERRRRSLEPLQWGQVTMPVPRQWLQWATKKESWMCLSWDVTMVNAVSCVYVGGGLDVN